MSLHLDRQVDHHLDGSSQGTGIVAPPPMQAALESRLLTPVKSTFSTVGRILTTGIAVSLFSLAVVGTAEHFAPAAWRPSTLLGAFGGREESAKALASLDAARAMQAMQHQEAQRAAQETVVVQANNQRISEAYGQLYQRGTMLASQWADAAKQTLVLNTQAKMEAMRGRFDYANEKDGTWSKLCDGLDLAITIFGGGQPTGCGDQLRQSAQNDRAAIQAEIMNGFRSQSAFIAASLRDWSNGMPDPAEMVAFQNKIGQTVPNAREVAPPALLPTVPVAAMKPL